jgi:hypothetical protein
MCDSKVKHSQCSFRQPMRTKVHFLNFDEVLGSLRALSFDVQGVPEVANEILVRKYGAGAILAQAGEPKPADKKVSHIAVTWKERPGYLVGGEVAFLLDRGHQKFWKSSRLEVPATAESLQAVHRFAEELRQVIGEPSLYNESLGTTSDRYLYDRVKGRDLPLAERPVPAWKLPPKIS